MKHKCTQNVIEIWHIHCDTSLGSAARNSRLQHNTFVFKKGMSMQGLNHAFASLRIIRSQRFRSRNSKIYEELVIRIGHVHKEQGTDWQCSRKKREIKWQIIPTDQIMTYLPNGSAYFVSVMQRPYSTISIHPLIIFIWVSICKSRGW